MDNPRFALRGGRTLLLRLGDITRWHGDAIVNAANEAMMGGAGVDGAIHEAAGPELLQECIKFPEVTASIRCPPGEARITRGYRLPVRHVIHTVGPRYKMLPAEESRRLLYSTYRNSLRLAEEHGVKTLAFPFISTGAFGYPKDEAAEVALQALDAEGGGLDEITMMLFSHTDLQVCEAAAEKLRLPAA